MISLYTSVPIPIVQMRFMFDIISAHLCIQIELSQLMTRKKMHQKKWVKLDDMFCLYLSNRVVDRPDTGAIILCMFSFSMTSREKLSTQLSPRSKWRLVFNAGDKVENNSVSLF
jgi:hypothetical protein